jgi:hypothetical protein
MSDKLQLVTFANSTNRSLSDKKKGESSSSRLFSQCARDWPDSPRLSPEAPNQNDIGECSSAREDEVSAIARKSVVEDHVGFEIC